MNPDPVTADLCDPLREDADAAAAGLRVLAPALRDFGGRVRFHGPVRTVRCHAGDRLDNRAVKALVESSGLVATPHGSVPAVLVVDGAGSMQRALVGGNLAAAAAANGWAGIVVDGAVRDTPELAALPLGVRALAACPLPCSRALPAVGSADVPVQVQGLPVHPGDWLYADEDGTVVTHGPRA